MTLSKRHYEEISVLIKRNSDYKCVDYMPLVEGLANILKKDNPRFDKATFFIACGMGEVRMTPMLASEFLGVER